MESNHHHPVIDRVLYLEVYASFKGGGEIRTPESRVMSPVPCRLATPLRPSFFGFRSSLWRSRQDLNLRQTEVNGLPLYRAELHEQLIKSSSLILHPSSFQTGV